MEYKNPSDYLPHAAPMVLIDKVIEVTDDSATTQCYLNDTGVLKPFLENNALPSYYCVELIAQTIGVWNGANQVGSTPDVGMILGSRDVKSTVNSFPFGKTLTIKVFKNMSDGVIANFEGKISIDGEVVSSGRVNVISLDEDAKNKIFKR
ncbi:MAG: 3-hydroxy-fatty acyl-ACP dehydratase [Succinatimonas sp.]|jgi:predicted hotdog family 3-hydroxylacyl-ACP dehydratase|nr:3-hydroxy-fatty acyl-ACP dehydratase [Succinatimonas sp.]MDY5722857.1 3-hydroxy-fatty acyl-ACP dehydratase [Succinivibrio sp.]